MGSISQPEWIKPIQPDPVPVLKVNNTMTHSKTEFIPASGKQVNWYTCGPTVYDKSHLGHARNYISFDIIRRIMEDYFNYDVNYIMNVTDIDDKIIITARSNYLFESKKASTLTLTPQVVGHIESAWRQYVSDPKKLGKYLAPEGNVDAFDALVASGIAPSFNDEPKFAMWLKAASRAKTAIINAKSILRKSKDTTGSKADVDFLFQESKDIYAPALDKELKHTVTDHKVFRDFAFHWEREFFKDMDALNVRRPDVLTRVSEYVPEIISFVEGIIKNGYAYENKGSVYFDTPLFDKDPHHHYAKLEPWSASNMKLVQEGEGDLSTDFGRTKADFALWKSSKPGEPAWDSPWGPGRPGWHIECSAMASDVLGENMDIHSGGSDLAFPHHDNELAQSEAHFNCKQWVNYFLHSGHLHVEGQKMSKSLKNFTSIAEALEQNTAAQIRIMFLLHRWDSVLDYRQSSLQEARVFESAVNKFLINVKSVVQESRSKEEELTGSHSFRKDEKTILEIFQKKQAEIHAALCDNFDTATAMLAIREIISSTNTYLKQTKKPTVSLLLKVSKYVSKLMRTFGVYKDENSEFGLAASSVAANGGSSGSVEEIAGPYVRLIASFRDRVRELARKSDGTSGHELLQLSDLVRDVELVDLNVALDDREDGTALVKFIDRETIIRQREEKKEAAAQAAAEKEKKKAELAAIEAERLAKGKIAPSEMFKDAAGRKLYSAWDDKGIPTRKVDGEEISKGSAKKLVKLYEAQVKLHEKYLASQK
ncbi:hypothetical protein HK100_010866 [Physocladia obscura]|uniref:cysteine--tRNA ligase n=1 Tax=Physocladia obscura TaxID=109957 RepID=A0AAD5T2M8_9FUNG|nr:hypothetical protein HK100_010866 [Physocladia obscura]